MLDADKKLLELIAKKLGYYLGYDEGLPHVRVEPPIAPDLYEWRAWDPLENDGDAFRLMVALNITIDSQSEGCKGVWAGPYDCAVEPYGINPCAATRRAIVRVAASSINYKLVLEGGDEL